MLRVRPILFTPNADAFARMLSALGLTPAEGAPGWRVFAADSGAVAIHAADEPSFSFGFEVGSADEFARRTVEAGTDAVVVDTADGRAAQVTSPDGRMFLAYETPLKHTAQPSEGLAVMPVWHTTSAAAGRRLFRNIGARERDSRDGGTVFTAKNGGLIRVQQADHDGGELAFECAGDLAALQQQLHQASIPSSISDGGPSPALGLPSPDGGEVRVLLRR